jgi:hypothetical protein
MHVTSVTIWLQIKPLFSKKSVKMLKVIIKAVIRRSTDKTITKKNSVKNILKMSKGLSEAVI